ncbi:MAG TPA: molybdopterin-dependent oxidoreductase [Burkholderiales bacterium]|nr:molybdopterin-dependent oxidoreductase [Burkholderiales bacterium]
MKLLRHPADASECIHASHWGSFFVSRQGDRLKVRPTPTDPDPSPLLRNIPDAARHAARIAQPVVRRGWLERGPGPDERRGRDDYVPVSWAKALDLAATELERVREKHGCASIYGGSYGWSSAGRFHHALSQVHRFLNSIGGYTAHIGSYSSGAADIILPRLFAPVLTQRTAVTWPDVAAHTELLVAFGGLAVKNAEVGAGGVGRHAVKDALHAAKARGARFVLMGPLRNDLQTTLDAEWVPLRPATDVAFMLALAHTLAVERLHDVAFLERCCVGYDAFENYLLGKDDGCPKSASWAEPITGIPAAQIRELARAMAAKHTLITISHSLQRAEHGEQPVWMGLALAAMLGRIGMPGAGYGYSMGTTGNVGKRPPIVPMPSLPQGRNGANSVIPVARIADMLLNPGAPFDFNGQRRNYPDIRLVYWAGGNPFHHHQDLNRLRKAFSRPETIIVNEPFWTSTVLHADIVFPSTVTLERDDISGSSEDNFLTPMRRVIEPYAQSRDDYEIFSELAARLGTYETFTEGLTSAEWIRRLYEDLRTQLATKGHEAPPFDEFWNSTELELPTHDGFAGHLRRFREDPSAAPLQTPSGKIEIFSETIARFGYADCAGHPRWFEPHEWLGSPRVRDFPLQLVSNQPSSRLHSQLDFATYSQETKVDGREIMRIHPDEAASRGIADGDVVKVFNDRGAFVAVARLSSDLHPGIVQVPTGAWWDPVELPGEAEGLCAHGNVNTVTRDVGTSRLAQACTGQLCLVQVERYRGVPPTGRGYGPPALAQSRTSSGE